MDVCIKTGQYYSSSLFVPTFQYYFVIHKDIHLRTRGGGFFCVLSHSSNVDLQPRGLVGVYY